MKQKTFDECFAWLEKFHGKKIPALARERWLEAFKDEHDDIFCRAMMLHDERTRPGLFPTIEHFRKLITEARERAWDKKKSAEPKRPLSRPSFAPDHRNVSRGLEWLRGINDILAGKTTADALIDRMNRSHTEESHQ